MNALAESDFLQVRHSPISGRGVFATRLIPIGSVVLQYIRGLASREPDYHALSVNCAAAQMSGVRYVGDIIIFNRELAIEDYMNHSDAPNILYHCGIGFASRDIPAGEELTADYRLYLPEGESVQVQGGTTIVGLTPKRALFESTRRLLALLQLTEGIHVP